MKNIIACNTNDSLELFKFCLNEIKQNTTEKLNLVDSATGHGKYAIIARDYGFNVTAFDSRNTRVPINELNIKWEICNITDFDYSNFDVIVLSGILYHMDINMILDLFNKIKNSKAKYLIINTHFIVTKENKVTNSKFTLSKSFIEKEYEMCTYDEGDLSSPLSAFSNTISHWLTLDSIEKLLNNSNFTDNSMLLPLVQDDRCFIFCKR